MLQALFMLAVFAASTLQALLSYIHNACRLRRSI